MRLSAGAAAAAGAVAAAALATLVFAPALGAFFVADDFFLLDAVVSGGPFGAWTRNTNFFRPLASASLWLDHRAWGLVPLPFHATNLALHLLASLAAASAARRLVSRFGAKNDESSRAGFLAGLFFLLLPAHAEAVNWISARPDLLAGFFALAALALALRHEETGKPSDALLSAGFFAASLLGKESGATWPLAAFLVLLPAPQGEGRRRGARLLTPSLLVLVLIAYLPLRALALGGLVRGYGERVHLNLSPLLLGDNLLRFLGRSLVPHLGLAESLGGGLSAATLLRVETWMDRGAGLLVLAAALALALRGRGAARRLALPSLGAFLVSSLPAANLGIGARGPEGERFLYLPSFFAVAAVAAVAGAISPSSRPSKRGVAALALAAAWGGALLAANLSWREAGALSRTIVFAFPAAPSDADETVLLALPDNVRGAYVARTFLPRALALFGQEKAWGRLTVLASTDLARPDARVGTARAGECWGVDPGKGVRIRSLIPPPPGSGFVVTAGSGGGYRACAPEARPSRRWAVVSGGAVVVLTSPASSSPPASPPGQGASPSTR